MTAEPMLPTLTVEVDRQPTEEEVALVALPWFTEHPETDRIVFHWPGGNATVTPRARTN